MPARAAVLHGRVCWPRPWGGAARTSFWGDPRFLNCSGAHRLQIHALFAQGAARVVNVLRPRTRPCDVSLEVGDAFAHGFKLSLIAKDSTGFFETLSSERAHCLRRDATMTLCSG